MTRCALLLSLLEEAGPRGITTAEILQAGVGSRYGARLMELRKAGHSITSERVREGSWRYTLLTHLPACGTQNIWIEPGVLSTEWICAPGCPMDAEVGGEETVRGRTKPEHGCPETTADLSARLFDPPSRYDELRERDVA